MPQAGLGNLNLEFSVRDRSCRSLKKMVAWPSIGILIVRNSAAKLEEVDLQTDTGDRQACNLRVPYYNFKACSQDSAACFCIGESGPKAFGGYLRFMDVRRTRDFPRNPPRESF